MAERFRAVVRGGVIAVAAVLAGCDSGGAGGLQLPPIGFAADAATGKVLFAQNCAGCHGADARGTTQGPPLLHAFYRPGHHGDAAFYMAVQHGSRQHHWHFGDMPPVPGVTPEQVAHIVAWVRASQRAVGIQ